MEKQKVLIVDDDPDFVEATKIVLQSKYQVAVASDGQECLSRVREERPDLILLDIMMAKGDEGFDVCREIKKNPQTSDIPVIMLTAVAGKTGFDFKPEVGNKDWLPADDYLDKPVDPSELLARVEKLLAQSIVHS